MPLNSTAIVIGAGAAGLAAARALTQAGTRVIVLEARDRVGGRIYSLNDKRFPTPVELGAEFVHSDAAELWDILDQRHINALEIPAEHMISVTESVGESSTQPDNQSALWSELHRWAESGGPDCSFFDFVQRFDFDEATVRSATAYVEGFNAADAKKISALSLIRVEDAIRDEAQFRLTQPYSSVTEALLDQCEKSRLELMLKAEVKSVDWKDGAVTCQLSDGRTIQGTAAIVTLPLPLLQRNVVSFTPPLTEKENALSLIEMGNVQRVTILFRKPFWEAVCLSGNSLKSVSFILGDESPFRTWWTLSPIRVPVLVGWNAGAAFVKDLDGKHLIDVAIKRLAKVLNLSENSVREEMVASASHNWQEDKFSQGAYAYCKTGGVDAPRTLAEPISKTLYFAGEATCWDGNIGTVNGALTSGLRAANEFLRDRIQR